MTYHVENMLQYFLSFKYILSTIQAKEIINSSDIVPTDSRRKRRIIVHDLVTRYGPQSVASASD